MTTPSTPSTAYPAGPPPLGTSGALTDRPRLHRLTTETKAAIKTTEFYIYLATVAGVLIASQAIGTERDHTDYFRADRAWLYIVVLTVGYMISRGLAKAGSHDHSDAE
jgi:hypothetical protein